MKRTKNFFIALLGFCLMGSGVIAQTFWNDTQNKVRYRLSQSGDYAVAEVLTVYDPSEEASFPAVIEGELVLHSEVTIGNSSYPVRSIKESGFVNQSKITSVELPVSITSIGNLAFYGCSSLGDLTIGDAVIGTDAFTGTVVSNLIFIDGLKTVPAVASQFASTLTTVTIPNSATAIAPSAFKNCSKIFRVNLNKVTSIGASAFSGCTMLGNIILTNVTSIGDYAFQNCTSLYSADLLSAASLGVGVFQGANTLSVVGWPSNYTNIPDCTFEDCEELTSVYNADNGNSVFTYLTDIGDEAFKGCYALKGQVEFSQSLTKIGTKAFQGVANVTEFKFNSNPKIEDEAFGAAITRNLYLTDDNVTAAFSGNSNTFTNVYYTRVIPTSESGKRKYAGLVLPFVPVTNDDYVYHKLAEVNGNELIFETSNTASANVPYLFENRSDNTTVTITGQNVTFGQSSTTDVVEMVGDWKAIGVYAKKTVFSNKKCYAISGGDFTQYVNELTVKPYRAYWRNDGASLANFMLRTSRGDVTAIKMAELDEVTLPTVYYDLTGRMVNNPVKGNIYIVNGKKVVF